MGKGIKNSYTPTFSKIDLSANILDKLCSNILESHFMSLLCFAVLCLFILLFLFVFVYGFVMFMFCLFRFLILLCLCLLCF